jgi:hypothetical protein
MLGRFVQRQRGPRPADYGNLEIGQTWKGRTRTYVILGTIPGASPEVVYLVNGRKHSRRFQVDLHRAMFEDGAVLIGGAE